MSGTASTNQPTPSPGKKPRSRLVTAFSRKFLSRTPGEAFAGSLVLGGGIYAVGLVVIVLLTCWGHTKEMGLSAALLLSGAALGAVVGFTFGIPKLAAAEVEGVKMKQSGRMVSNSNYGKVSDWLTTLVVGLGLVQFGSVLDGLGWLSARFNTVFEPLGLGTDGGAVYGMSLLIASFAALFLLMFMWTSVRYLEVSGTP